MSKELKPFEKELKDLVENTKVDRSAEYKLFSKNLQKSLYYFSNENVFIGGLLQEMIFRPSYDLPTAALTFNPKSQEFMIVANPTFFNSLDLEHQMGVLHHEILHFTNSHVFRFSMERTTEQGKKDAKAANIATDMAINQYIRSLPKGCVDVKYFQKDDGTPFPLFSTAEVYLELLKDNPKAMENASKNMEKDGIKIEGDGDAFGDGQTLDQHAWDEMSEEDKKNMAEEVKKMVKRTMEKTSYDKSDVPGGIKDLIEELDTFLRKLNYKRILQECIKKTVSFTDRSSTWKRPNKRYGKVAAGTTLGKLPQLNIYIDTSGSISVKEMNEFLAILNGFLKAGTRKCTLGFWHTNLYNKRKYKMNSKIASDEIESGGTDMTDVCKDINESSPDLSIILTDGYYDTRVKPKNQTIVIISDSGGMNHPLKNDRNVKTLNMSGLRK